MNKLKAIIFDMDGLLVDSEHLWRKAEVEVFKTVGVNISEDDCARTMGLRVDEVVSYWRNIFPWKGATTKQIADKILNRVVELVKKEAKPMAGVVSAFEEAMKLNIKVALASSSADILIDAVVDKFKLKKYLVLTYSATKEKYGKPHPAVYISTAKILKVRPEECIAIEDSLNGVLSAKAAKIKCIAVPEKTQRRRKEFYVADKILKNLNNLTASVVQKTFNNK